MIVEKLELTPEVPSCEQVPPPPPPADPFAPPPPTVIGYAVALAVISEPAKGFAGYVNGAILVEANLKPPAPPPPPP